MYIGYEVIHFNGNNYDVGSFDYLKTVSDFGIQNARISE